MEISAAMNIHDLAMTKTMRNQADAQEKQEKQEKLNMRPAEEIADQKRDAENGPGALANTATQQVDPQATSLKIERQVDTQAAKENVPGAEGKGSSNTPGGTGNLLDIMT